MSELDEVRGRTPGMKLLFAVLIAAALAVPLMMIYALVWDRQDQSQTARQAITQGWGGSQVVTGPVLAIPYTEPVTETEMVDGEAVTRTTEQRRMLYLSPERQQVSTKLDPEQRRKSIYQSVIYEAVVSGEARFVLPPDLTRRGIVRERMDLGRAELRFGVSDARGLQADSRIVADGQDLATRPGNGPAATDGSGFFAYADWDGAAPLSVAWRYDLRGSEYLALVPRGGQTDWQVTSSWPHPGFEGSFLPVNSKIGEDGFTARFSVSDLALGQDILLRADNSAPVLDNSGRVPSAVVMAAGGESGASMVASVNLIEPVDLYSRIDRSVKYGFLIIGFTFLAFLMFDIVAGATVSAPEYLLTGAGLVLFFALLLAFAEVIGFAAAYLVASVAIIALITAYSAAVLRSWGRARIIGVLLAALYAVLFVLLNLEAWSLLIGSILLFVALAGVMYATRRVDWTGLSRRPHVAD